MHHATAVPARTAEPAPGLTPRIAVLDVLRGIAIIGIIPVNVSAIAHWGYDTAPTPRPDDPSPIDVVTGLVFEGRMMPLFALLFGIGFALFLRSARTRTPRPRVVLTRRLVFLAIVGVLHHLVYPGEVLAFYAVGGMIILLPASFLPRWLPLVGGIVLTIAGAPFSGPLLIPGLFLLGLAIAEYDLVTVLMRRQGILATAFGVFTVAAGSVATLQLDEIALGSFSKPGRIAGVLTMFALATGVMLLMRSSIAARTLTVLFAPLGRMAFTNYLCTTALVLALACVIDAPSISWTPEYGYIVMAAAAPLLWAFSTLWLRFFRFGPLEWVWRTVTWWKPQPLRRSPHRAGD